MGIDEQFMKGLVATMKPDSSALFVMVRSPEGDGLGSELKGTGGKILKTSLTHENAAKLQAALSEAKA